MTTFRFIFYHAASLLFSLNNALFGYTLALRQTGPQTETPGTLQVYGEAALPVVIAMLVTVLALYKKENRSYQRALGVYCWSSLVIFFIYLGLIASLNKGIMPG